MQAEHKVYLINFDKPLPNNVINEIKQEYKDIKLVIVEKKVIIHFNRQIYIQCVNVRKRLEEEYEGIFSGDYPIIVNLPGLSMAAVYLVNEIEASLRAKPKILELIRLKGTDNLFTNFEFRRILDLDYNRNVSRNYIKEKREET